MNDKLFEAAGLHQDVAGESRSLFTGVSDFFTKGVPLVVGSGLTSMYNTAVSLGNAFGADAEKIDFGAKVADYDDDLAAYYKEHQTGVDLGGFLVTSLIPGTVGIKALKMAQGGIAGTNTAATTGLLKNTQNVFGFFRNAELKYTEKALDRVRLSINEVYDHVSNEKLIAIAAGIGDQALQGAAFQTAVLLTMNQSPVLSKADESYFTSLLSNSHEILTAGAIQGVIGGGFVGLSIAGKVKKALYDKDIAEFPSRHYNTVGTSETLGRDPGTALAADFNYWKQRTKEFEIRQQGGVGPKIAGEDVLPPLTDTEINKYKRTLHNQEMDIRKRITKMTEEQEDGPLSHAIWDAINKAEDPVEAMNLMAAAAKKFERLTTEFQPAEASAIKVFTIDGELPARKANNILARGKIAPDIFSGEGIALVPDDPNIVKMRDFISPQKAASQELQTELNKVSDDLTQRLMLGEVTIDQIKHATAFTASAKERLENIKKLIGASSATSGPKPFAKKIITPELLKHWTDQGFELYKDAAGTLHVLEESKYAKHVLTRDYKNVNPTLVMKLNGDQAGQITEVAYPTVGDIGTPSIGKKGEFLVDGAPWQGLPEKFDPLTTEPIQSNAAFVYAALKPLDDVEISLAKGDLPMLEKFAKEGIGEDIFVSYAGKAINEGEIEQLLLAEKLEMRQALLDAGHDYKKISRELNVTESFAESGSGDGFILSKLEDHTKPGYAVINYETGRLPDGFHVRGIASLMARIQLGYNMNHTTVAEILGPWYAQLPKTNGTLLNISSVERFSSLLASTSPDYGGFGLVAQQSGKVVAAAKREAQEAVLTGLNGLSHQVRQNPEALIELNQVVNKVRKSNEKMFIWPPGAQSGDDIVFVPQSVYKKLQKAEDTADVSDDVVKAMREGKAFEIKNKEVEDLLLQSHAYNQTRATKWNKLFAAMGSGRTYNVDEFYLPPINTRKYPFVAFVKEKMSMGTGDVKEAGVIVAHDKVTYEAKLNRMREVYGDRFEFIPPSDIKKWKEIEGEYYDKPFLGDSMPDAALRKEGLLYDFAPRTDDEIINDLNQWHFNQEGNIIHQSIELHYAQEFAELRAMGQDYAVLALERFGPKDRKSGIADNPYYRYVHTALNINDFERYNSIWGKINDATEGIAKKVFSAWDTMREKATAGEVDWETANRIASSYGFTPPYEKVIPSLINPKIDNRSFQGSIAKANGAVSTLTLGLDFLNSLINVVSFPVMATAEMRNILNNVVKGDANKIGKLAELTSVQVPGAQYQLPTPMKLLHNAAKSMFSEDAKATAAYFEKIGSIRTPNNLYLDVVEASRLSPEALASPEGMKAWTEVLHEKATKLAEIGKTATGYNKAEWAVRYMASHMMKQLTDAAGVAATDAPAYINAFVNRVHGNYLASQRPHLFQGPIGQAISLFQTYQFNIMQNMIRYVQQGDKTAVAMLLGMQNTIFGMQSNPGFYILNQAIGNANSDHIDITSASANILGTEVSNWMLYGLGSNALNTSLYNRGDLTPRYVTVVPTKVEDVPAVAIPARAISSFLDTARNIAKGGDVVPSLLNGIAHFGANRPLSGLAQLTQGYRTTAAGNLLTAYTDVDGWTVAAKLAGGEELNRAIAIDAYYRTMAYKAEDKEKVQRIGTALKTTMYKGEQPSEEQVLDFMNQYTRASGNPQSFNRFITSNFKHANQSQLNDLMQHVNSKSGRILGQLMGGDETPDFFNQAPAAPTE